MHSYGVALRFALAWRVSLSRARDATWADESGRIFELVNQFQARRSAYFSRPSTCLKNRGHCVPHILEMIQEGL